MDRQNSKLLLGDGSANRFFPLMHFKTWLMRYKDKVDAFQRTLRPVFPAQRCPSVVFFVLFVGREANAEGSRSVPSHARLPKDAKRVLEGSRLVMR